MLTTSDTARYATTIALEISGEQLALMTDYLNDMDQFVSVLDSVHTEGVEPMHSPMQSEEMLLRDDVAQRFPNVDAIMQNAPDVREGFIAVKKVIEK